MIQAQKPIAAENPGQDQATMKVIKRVTQRVMRTLNVPRRFSSWSDSPSPLSLELFSFVFHGSLGRSSRMASQIGKSPSGNLVYEVHIIML